MTVVEHDVIANSDAVVPAATAPLAEWLSWLEAGRGDHIDLGLERCRLVAERLGIVKPAPIVVTVAGTNGKGSSVALLESVWRQAGYRLGTYTSPHLIDYNERIRINGVPIEPAKICSAFATVEHARGDVPLTYFEFATLAALYLFQESPLDLVILEVGLGGRLDAVNIVDPDVALIAAIGLDHEDWLGETRELIGREKAGIMRAGTPAVCSDHAAPNSISAVAREIGAQLMLLGVEFAYETGATTWTWWCSDRVLENLPMPALSGVHQFRNAAGVLRVLMLLEKQLPVDEANIREGLLKLVLSGRFDRISADYEYVLDVAHNPQAAEIFSDTLRTLPTARQTHALIGMLKTKNHREFLRPLLGQVDTWHFADLPGIKGARSDDLAASLRALDRHAHSACYSDVAAAHRGIMQIAKGGVGGDRILVLGSFMTVGAMMQLFGTERGG